MTIQIIIRPETEADLARAFLWYEERGAGVGGDFLSEVKLALMRIVESPFGHRVIYKNVRRTLVRKFPYKIFFLVEGDQAVILGVIHARRHHREWKSRIIP